MAMRRVTIALSLAGLAGVGTAAAAEGPSDPSKTPPRGIFRGAFKPDKFDISPPLRSIPIAPPQIVEEERKDDPPSGLEGPLGPQSVDPVVQSRVGKGEIPGPNLSWDGFDGLGPNPPDPTGEVGPNHFFAAANLRFAIYSKTGTLMFGPANHNTIYSGFGGPCETTNSGDPVVLHDQLANRWLFGRLTGSGILCMAVTTSSDPTGTWFRYAFSSFGSLPDYPKWSVWPDAYYFSSRDFSGPFIGVGAYAVDRAAVLVGNPSATLISFLAPPGGTPYNVGDGLLPADLDGTVLPAPGSPNYFVGTMDDGGPYGAPQDAITLWKFHADFGTPGNSTFTLTNTIPVAAFDSIFPCTPAARACIPQPPPTGATQKLDHLGYRQRPTFRLAYRNHGTYESLVTNQSVEAPPNIAGIRWYEIRDPNGTPFIFQQGTYSPGATDGIHRWMGSIMEDQAGNIGLAYSVSDATVTFPGIRYTGRLVTDPPGTMPQGEGTIVNGIGAQLTTNNRWGDYTQISPDPVDDCTFWYINEYYPVSAATAWRLRVGSFTYPPPLCVPVPVTLQSFGVE